MCTLMQKDAGIEMVAEVIAVISQYQLTHGATNQTQQDWRAAVEWRKKLYKHSELEVDYSEVVGFQTEMHKRYAA